MLPEEKSDYLTQRDANLEKICIKENRFLMIDVTHDVNRTEIRDNLMGATVTVYRPSMESSYVKAEDSDKRVMVHTVVPGFINASSWATGDFKSRKNGSELSMIQTERYQRMVMLAIEYLNKFNETLEAWTGVTNHAQELRDEKFKTGNLTRRLDEIEAKAANRKRKTL